MRSKSSATVIGFAVCLALAAVPIISISIMIMDSETIDPDKWMLCSLGAILAIAICGYVALAVDRALGHRNNRR